MASVDDDREAALKAFIEAAEEYREDNIQQSDKDDEGLEPIAQSRVKPAVQRLQRIYGRGRRPKLPYPQSVTWRKLVRRTDSGTPILPEECGSDIVEGLLTDLVEWAQAELRGAVFSANRAEPATLAELSAWIASARELLRDQEDQPIEKAGIAYLVRKHFLDHLERLYPVEWPAWHQTFQPQKFPAVRDLVAMMASVAQRIGSKHPVSTIVEGFAAGTGESISLTKEDMDILRALYAKHPQALTQEALTERDAADLSLRTVRDRLKILEQAGLVHKPHGPKKGYALTDKAIAILENRRPG